MIETDITKLESSSCDGAKSLHDPSSAPTTSSWSRWKDPRIVRVSKALGGKDRHSKVCTVRGLRDRRVRLSVPTAIKLYDLQDRLGLNQPSKVVDWLLNAAKHEIDELPPLQIPPGIFQPHQISQSAKHSAKFTSPNFLGEKSKEVGDSGETSCDRHNWGRINQTGPYVSENPSSISSLLFNSVPYSSQIVRNHGLTAQSDDWHNLGLFPMPATSSSHQVLVYQPGISTHSYFSSQIVATTTATNAEFDSSGQPVGAIHFLNNQNKGNI